MEGEHVAVFSLSIVNDKSGGGVGKVGTISNPLVFPKALFYLAIGNCFCCLHFIA
jgi:hypothetical protein